MQSEFRSSCTRIHLPSQPTDLNFSPVSGLLLVGFINGRVQVYECSSRADSDEEEVDLDPIKDFVLTETSAARQHRGSVRAVLHNEDGSRFAVAYSNGSLHLFDTCTSKRIRKIPSAHNCEVYRIENLHHDTFASGDDQGVIKVWDVRQKRPIGELEAHLDYVTDMVYLNERKVLVASSGDTSLTMSDVRAMRVSCQSHDGFMEEGMALQPLHNEQRIICGTSSGKVACFGTDTIDKTHAWFSNARIHRGSIDSMVTFDDKTVITGCADGAIRALRFDPNRLLGVIGRHKEPDTIETISINYNSSILASIGLEDCVRLWDIEDLKILGSRTAQDSQDDGSKRSQPMLSKREKKRLKKQQYIPNFFSDLNTTP